MQIDEGCLYSREHEWIKVEGDRARIGISDFAQHQLGDIVFIELPELNSHVELGSPLAVIESVKAISTVYSFVSGRVVEVNQELEDTPQLINESPYEGWIALILISNPGELDSLMTPQEYQQYCQEQADN